jgi:hypothetical protein
VSHLDVDTAAVAGAGRRTSTTAATWEAWASRSENVLRNCASEVRDSTFGAAIEGYLSGQNPAMKRVAQQVDALGTNTVSAANTVANSDTSATALLNKQGAREDGLTSQLRRPISP